MGIRKNAYEYSNNDMLLEYSSQDYFLLNTFEESAVNDVPTDFVYKRICRFFFLSSYLFLSNNVLQVSIQLQYYTDFNFFCCSIMRLNANILIS